jgi:hypothetical protein
VAINSEIPIQKSRGRFLIKGSIYFAPTHIFALGMVLKVFFGSGEEHPFYHFTGIPFGIAAGYLIVAQMIVLACIPQIRHTFKIQFESLGRDVTREDESRDSVIFFALTFPIFTFLYCWLTVSNLFQGVDGDYLLALNSNQRFFDNPPHFFTSNIFQGLGGNVFNPINVRLDIGFNFLYFLGNLSEVGKIGAVTLWSSSLFFSSWYFFRSFKLAPSTSFFSASTLSICTLFPSSLNFTSVLFQFPWLATPLSALCLLLAFRNMMFTTESKNRYVLLSGFIVFYLVLLSPTWLIIFVPFYLLYFLITLFYYSLNSQRFKIQSLFTLKRMSLGLLLMSFTTLISAYILGFFLNSSAFVFASEMESPSWALKQISMIFRSPLNSCFILFALVGGVFTARLKSRVQILGLCFILYYLIQIIYGCLAYNNLLETKLPFPSYFEMASYPAISLMVVMVTQGALKALRFNLNARFTK